MRALAVVGLFLLTACHPWIFHPVDNIAQSRGKLDKTPFVYVHLGQAQQICAGMIGENKTVPVDIFVDLYNLPAQEVKLRINGDDRHTFVLRGTNVQLHLTKVGLGYHQVEVWVEGYREEPVVLSWSVWNCPPVDRGELYKPDSSGLKGYCPEPEPCECPKDEQP